MTGLYLYSLVYQECPNSKKAQNWCHFPSSFIWKANINNFSFCSLIWLKTTMYFWGPQIYMYEIYHKTIKSMRNKADLHFLFFVASLCACSIFYDYFSVFHVDKQIVFTFFLHDIFLTFYMRKNTSL